MSCSPIDVEFDIGLHGGLAACDRLMERRAQIEAQPPPRHAVDIDIGRAAGKFEIFAGPHRGMHDLALRIHDDIGRRIAFNEQALGKLLRTRALRARAAARPFSRVQARDKGKIRQLLDYLQTALVDTV